MGFFRLLIKHISHTSQIHRVIYRQFHKVAATIPQYLRTGISFTLIEIMVFIMIINYLSEILNLYIKIRRGLVVRVLDSRLSGRGFDPHTGHGSLLKLRQFHLPLICLSILSCK